MGKEKKIICLFFQDSNTQKTFFDDLVLENNKINSDPKHFQFYSLIFKCNEKKSYFYFHNLKQNSEDNQNSGEMLVYLDNVKKDCE